MESTKFTCKSYSEMRVAVAQLDVALGDKEANLEKVEGVLSRTRAELVLFPELFTTGFDFPNLEKLAEPLNGETMQKLRRMAGNRVIAGTILESAHGKLYNTFVLLDKHGIIAKYRKIHLFGEEKRYFTAGSESCVVHSGNAALGLATCYDLRFPELFRQLVLRGSEVFMLSAEFPAPRQEHFDVLVKARAIENQCFMLACNRVGRDKHNSYAGGSAVISPWGEVLARAGEEEAVLEVDIAVEDVGMLRHRFPVLKDMRKELFRWYDQG